MFAERDYGRILAKPFQLSDYASFQHVERDYSAVASFGKTIATGRRRVVSDSALKVSDTHFWASEKRGLALDDSLRIGRLFSIGKV
jgi:hypothetical protein